MTGLGLPNDHPIMLQAMRAIQASKRATELMDEHGLIEAGWQFRVSRTKNTLGRCFYKAKVIEFSEHYLHEPWEQIEDTILHEIAHALAYTRYGKEDGTGHGYLWKRTCVEIGANPERTAHATSAAKYNYEIRCSSCGKVTSRRYRLRNEKLTRYISKCCKARLEAYDIRATTGGE